MEGEGRRAKRKKKSIHGVYFLTASAPSHLHLWPWLAWREVAGQAHLIQTTLQDLEGGYHHVSGSYLSDEGLGSVTESQGCLDVLQ